jgi:hypothetical protein
VLGSFLRMVPVWILVVVEAALALVWASLFFSLVFHAALAAGGGWIEKFPGFFNFLVDRFDIYRIYSSAIELRG